MNERLTEKPKGNIAMPGQKISEKWCNKTSRFRSRVGDMSRNKSYSRGTYNEKANILNSVSEFQNRLTEAGNLLVATGLLVDQAKVWAEPQATRLIFLPCKAATNLGL